MTLIQLAKRLGMTWFSVSLFAFSVLYLFVLFATLLIEHTGGPRLGGIGIG